MLRGRLIIFVIAVLVVGIPGFHGSAAKESFSLKDAAKQNAQLQYSLKWFFGRRPQRGWYIYTALIQKTIGTNAGADSEEFAGNISTWQRLKRLPPNGVLNQRTLLSLIRHWQSRRLKPIVLAKETELRSAPISDFFDETRDSELLKVENETYRVYKRLVAAAAADKRLGLDIAENGKLSDKEKFLKIISSYRSPAYQASLRKKQPGASRAQIAFKSPHFTGKALDIYVGGEPVTTKDFNRALQVRTPVYKWLVENADKFGFRPYFYEPWHWEYVGSGN